MRRKAPVPFGKGPTEKDPNHGHLAGGLLHSAGGRTEKDLHPQAPRRAADPAYSFEPGTWPPAPGRCCCGGHPPGWACPW